jgi:hypothetical protein
MNELEKSDSAYLLHHSKNPIFWKPWTHQTLDLAQKKNKLIILSIGYSACHWCHVMEREAFNDSHIAKVMNQYFISVKVDKEEHPEVDNVYMDFLLETKGSGGWPLNCILLPSGEPLYAGTYYNANDWINLISRFSNIFTNNPKKLYDYSKNYIEYQINNVEQEPSKDVDYKSSLKDWLTFIDLGNGGLNSSQKFPMPNFLSFLMQLPYNKDWDVFKEKTIKNIAQKGLFDHVDGGFFRYCIDENWDIPHFEKMLYDNGQLISVFSNYDLAVKKNNYVGLVEKTIEFWLQIKGKNILFPSSVDADNIEGEGGYYLFNKIQIEENFSEKEFKYCQIFFNMTNKMLRDNKWHIHKKKSIPNDFEENLLLKLKNLRNTNHFPAIDSKAICSWNCMMIIGLIDASVTYQKSNWFEIAKTTTRLVLNNFTSENQCYRLVYTNKTIFGTLEDYSWLVALTIKMGHISDSDYWMNQSIKWTNIIINKFWTDDKNLFAFSESKSLYKKAFEIEDQVIPSSNSVMGNILYELYIITYEKTYLEIMNKMMNKVGDKAQKWLPNYTNWMMLSNRKKDLNKQYVLVGYELKELWDLYHQKEILDQVYILEKDSEILIFKEKYQDEGKNIFICNENSCLSNIKNLRDALSVTI